MSDKTFHMLFTIICIVLLALSVYFYFWVGNSIAGATCGLVAVITAYLVTKRNSKNNQ